MKLKAGLSLCHQLSSNECDFYSLFPCRIIVIAVIVGSLMLHQSAASGINGARKVDCRIAHAIFGRLRLICVLLLPGGSFNKY